MTKPRVLGRQCLRKERLSNDELASPSLRVPVLTLPYGSNTRPGGLSRGMIERTRNVFDSRTPRQYPEGYEGSPTQARTRTADTGHPPNHTPRAKPAAQDALCILLHPTAKQSGRRDLNPGPPAPKAGALPGCATPRTPKSRARAVVTRLRSLAGGDKSFSAETPAPAPPAARVPPRHGRRSTPARPAL
jgi:hypothetical protein